MARIVSGIRQEKGLPEFQLAYDLFSRHKRGQEQKQQQEFENELVLRKTMAAMQQERLKSQQILNQSAQQGDARALQELALRAKRGKVEGRAEDALQILSGITDEDARKDALKAVQSLFEEEDRQELMQGANDQLQQASESGLFQPEQIQDWSTRVQDDPASVSKEIMQVRRKAGEDATNQKENEEALAQAQSVVESLPRGSFERREAEIALNAVLADESGLGKQGMGAKTLKAVQQAALGQREGFEQRQALGPEMPGLGGMRRGEMQKELGKEPTLGFGGPDIPPFTGGTHATTKGLKAGTLKPGPKGKGKMSPKNLAKDLIQRPMGSKELMRAFKDRGFDVNDPSVLEEIKAALMEARDARSRGE